MYQLIFIKTLLIDARDVSLTQWGILKNVLLSLPYFIWEIYDIDQVHPAQFGLSTKDSFMINKSSHLHSVYKSNHEIR